jgi:NADH-quinone oxidoreductase subunit J
MNWHSFFFLLFAMLACGFALAVVVTASVVRMAFFLVISLGATAGLFFLAGAEFVGAMQLMIYVGGTLVLLIFGVMLTAQGPFVSMKTRGGEWILGLVVGGALLSLLIPTAFAVKAWAPRTEAPTAEAHDNAAATPIGGALLGYRVDKQSADDGRAGYLFPFEIVSVHLLVVLIAAAYLARPKKRAVGRGQ